VEPIGKTTVGGRPTRLFFKGGVIFSRLSRIE
jgi:hypothetical protein